jgi:predicted metal-binding membrane protein
MGSVVAMTEPPRVRGLASLRAGVARTSARHPEWWLVAASALAWAVLLWQTFASHAGMWGQVHTGPGYSSRPAAAGGWLLMVVAMMGPVMVPRVRYVARCCVGQGRTRVIAQTLAGALVVWTAVGLLVVGIGVVAESMDAAEAPVGFSVVWLLVAWWQLSASKASALARCRAIPVPRGRADGRGRLTAGVAYAGWCVVSCGPAMVAMAMTGHPLLLMVVLTVGLTAERVTRQPSRVTRRLAAWICGSAAVWLAITFLIA